MRRHFLIFAARWLGNSLVLALLASWPDAGLSFGAGPLPVFWAGLAVTLINALVRPLLVLAALPFLMVTLGFFTLAVNYAVIFLSAKFYGPFEIDGLFWGLIAGLAVGLINYLVTVFLAEAD